MTLPRSAVYYLVAVAVIANTAVVAWAIWNRQPLATAWGLGGPSGLVAYGVSLALSRCRP